MGVSRGIDSGRRMNVQRRDCQASPFGVSTEAFGREDGPATEQAVGVPLSIPWRRFWQESGSSEGVCRHGPCQGNPEEDGSRGLNLVGGRQPTLMRWAFELEGGVPYLKAFVEFARSVGEEGIVPA